VQRELREAEHRRVSREQRQQLLQNEKLAAMGTLLAAVAHELNNPLAVVVAQASLLQRTLENDPRQVRSEKILEAAERCARIVRNFLAMARQQPPERATVSLNQIIADTVELLAYGLRVDNIDLQLELSEPAPLVFADPHQLQQVIINLVTNAHDALRARASSRLTIRSELHGERAVFEVEDTGEGIPADIRARIFEPFFTTKPVGKGTGLGLALCHGIITSHGGAIAVESEVGKGTVFRIDLPAAASEPPSRDVLHPERARVTPKRILVVDDEPEVASGLLDILTLEGHRVDVASGGETALRLADMASYDLVMSDMRMPEMDGPTLYRQLVAHHPSLAHRFIFLTGDMFRSDADEFFKETGAVYLGKPCTYDEIVEAVERVLSTGRP
jgi:CheY-like chemotaxis protein